MNITSLFTESYDTWKENLQLTYPYLIRDVILYCLSALLVFTFGLYLFNGDASRAFMGTINTSSTIGSILQMGLPLLLLFAAVTLVFVIFKVLLSFFLGVAGIGMAKEAMTRMKQVSFSTAGISYGKRFVWRFALLAILTILIMVTCLGGLLLVTLLAFLMLGILANLLGITSFQTTSSYMLLPIFILLLVLAFSIAAIVFMLAFMFAPYALIYDDIGVIEALKRSYSIFRHNVKDVFMLAFSLSLLTLFLFIVFVLLPTAIIGFALYKSFGYTDISSLLGLLFIGDFFSIAGLFAGALSALFLAPFYNLVLLNAYKRLLSPSAMARRGSPVRVWKKKKS